MAFGPIFDIKLTGLKALFDFAKRAPADFKKAQMTVLNDLGFMVRRSVIGTISQKMKVRNRAFVSSRVQVTKSTINHPTVKIGSVATNRFSAWLEQETGREPARNRIASLIARGGTEAGQIKKTARMQGEFPSTKDFQDARGGDPGNRIAMMIRTFDEAHRKEPFIIDEKNSGFPPGLYKLKGGYKTVGTMKYPRLALLQTFDKKPKAKRLPWMREAKDLVLQHVNLQVLWDNAIKRVLGR
ncbi:MAG: hypothetical protein ABSF77_18605 [Spirochaetia bacterium]|jgi:hypothetical protein